MALIRYPGSKAKLAGPILQRLPDEICLPMWMDTAGWEYREPFFGAGAIGFRILRDLPKRTSVWLNDKDPGIVCLWNAVRSKPERMKKLIMGFRPSVELYEKYKELDSGDKVKEGDFTTVGFRKLALHQMSFSGLGVKSGGPLGGKDQDNGKYTVDCRWNSQRLCRDVNRYHAIFKAFGNRLRITRKDFTEVFADDRETAFIYCDPPYYLKGPELYKHSFTDHDHAVLAARLRTTRCQWALSYDDHPKIRDWYSWASFAPIEATYTIGGATGKRPKNREVLITKEPALKRAGV